MYVRLIVREYDFFSVRLESDTLWGSSAHTTEVNVYSNPSGRGVHKGTPRPYSLNREGDVVFDKTTGLHWVRAGSDYTMPWDMTGDFVAGLNEDRYGGFDDWRLPTLEEALSLVEPVRKNADRSNPRFLSLYIDPIFDAAQRRIWSADKYAASPVVDWEIERNLPRDRSGARSRYSSLSREQSHACWHVSFDDGCCRCYQGGDYWVRPVRADPVTS